MLCCYVSVTAVMPFSLTQTLSLTTAELSGQDALQEELHENSEWFKIPALSYVSTAFQGPDL